MKKNGLLTIVAILLLVSIFAASLVAGTYARYATTLADITATATAATWSFAYGDAQATSVTLVPTETFANLASGKIAPGTAGSFDVKLDGTGSETGIKYTISVDTSALPAGLTLTPNTSLEGYIPYNAATDAMKKTVTVNWAWAIGEDADNETGINNDDAGDTVTVTVSVKGEQHIDAIS